MSFSVRRGCRVVTALAIPLFTLSFSAPETAASPPARSAYVVSSNDASLTRVDLDSGAVTPNVATVGSIPNRVDVADDALAFVVVNSGSDDVTVFDTVTENVLGAISLPVGANPWAAQLVGDRLFVSALRHDVVYELDLATGAMTGAIPVGRAPEGLCVADGKLYVANTGFDFDSFSWDPGSVTVIDLATASTVAEIPVDLNPQECLSTPDGHVHVICTGDFFLSQGAVNVIDPAVDTVTSTFPVAGYPGGGDVHPAGAVFLNVTTPEFTSEVHAYESVTGTWIFDETSPLLPSLDFYGNLRSTGGIEILVPSFAQDLLLIVDPGSPETPAAVLVGDGPIDVAVVEREGPVPVLVSGLSARVTSEGVLLTWRANIDGDLLGFVVQRREGAEPWNPAAELPPVREASWLDRDVATGHPRSYRVGVVHFAGDVTWTAPLSFSPRESTGPRLAVRTIRPNPSRSEVTLELALPWAADVSLRILNVAGQRVTSLDLGRRSAGVVEVRWDGRDSAGRIAGPGLYLARFEAGGESAVARLLRVR